MIAANPGGPGHHWLARRYVFQSVPRVPFHEDKSKREFVSCPSVLEQNPFLDRAQYKAQLESACASDPELPRAWAKGDWAVARGAYFAGCLEESRNAVGPFHVLVSCAQRSFSPRKRGSTWFQAELAASHAVSPRRRGS